MDMLSIFKRKPLEEKIREYLAQFNIIEKFNHVLKTYFPEVPPKVIKPYPVPLVIAKDDVLTGHLRYCSNGAEIYFNVLYIASLYAQNEKTGDTEIATLVTMAAMFSNIRHLIEDDVLRRRDDIPHDIRLLYEVPVRNNSYITACLLTMARSPDLTYTAIPARGIGLPSDDLLYCAAREALLYAREHGIALDEITSKDLLWRACVKYRDPSLSQ